MDFQVYTFLEELRQKKIHFTLASYREQTIMIQVDVPGERWEVEFFESGKVEVEIFKSNGEIFDQKTLNELINRFGE